MDEVGLLIVRVVWLTTRLWKIRGLLCLLTNTVVIALRLIEVESRFASSLAEDNSWIFLGRFPRLMDPYQWLVS